MERSVAYTFVSYIHIRSGPFPPEDSSRRNQRRLEQANKHLLEKFMELLEVVNETTDLEITVVENGEKYKMRK